MKVYIVMDNGNDPDTIAVFSSNEKAIDCIFQRMKQVKETPGVKIETEDLERLYDDGLSYLYEEDGSEYVWFILERDLL